MKMYAEQVLKKCSKCKLEKQLSEFHNNRAQKDGKDNNCQQCCRSRYHRDKVKRLAKRKAYYEKNKEVISIKNNRAGASLDKFNQLFLDQEGKCAICGLHQEQMPRRIAVDHNHDTGEIRGLLCDTCNRGLGLLRDNIEVLENAIKYLKKYLK